MEKKYFLSAGFIILMLIHSLGVAMSQSETVKINFLETIPGITGSINHRPESVLLNKFSGIYPTDDDIDIPNASYYIGYNHQFLYFYIEVESDSLVLRDRAYQNGDGFHLMIGEKGAENTDLTGRFYVLAFSPAKDWSNKLIWYHNVDLAMRRLSSNVIFEAGNDNGFSVFQLLIPWSEIPPYHPWDNNDLAVNLCFVKAVGRNEKVYYFIKTDERMQSEQSKRKYANPVLELPSQGKMSYSFPARRNFMQNSDITVRLVNFSDRKSSSVLEVNLFDSENNLTFQKSETIDFDPGLCIRNLVLPEFKATPGVYDLDVLKDKLSISKTSITIVENFNIEELYTAIISKKEYLSAGSRSTMKFYLEDLSQKISDLSPEDFAISLNEEISQFKAYLDLITEFSDPISEKRGMFRRGFLSDTDNTYRPYSVYVPESYTADTSHPLLVYLHGSGEDDRALFRTNFIKDDFVVLAPNGRGTSNCFSTPEAIADVFESISDILDNYNIDQENIILSGFSMGGYGVYRIFHKRPELFSAIAVLSGHPNLAEKWGFHDIAINFLDDQNLRSFSSIPIFIYHGVKDLNCPFHLTEELVKKLQKVNPDVTFLVDERAGHGFIDEKSREEYHRWLVSRKK